MWLLMRQCRLKHKECPLKRQLGTVHLKSGRGAGQFGTCCVWNTMAPFNSCVFFLDPPLFIVRKIMAPTEYFPDNLEENVNVKMVLIVEKARFTMAIGLSNRGEGKIYNGYRSEYLAFFCVKNEAKNLQNLLETFS